MTRIWWIESRRSTAARLGPALLAMNVLMLLTLPAAAGRTGRWMALTMHQRMSLGMLLPLAVAGGAWQLRRDRRHRVEELLSSTPRPRWQRLAPTAVAMATWAGVAYLVVFGAFAAWGLRTASYYPTDTVVIIAVGVVSLVAATWVGMAIGRALPYLVTAPILAVVLITGLGVMSVLVTPDGDEHTTFPRFLFLSPTPSNVPGDAVTIAGRVDTAQAVWWVCLAATAFALLSVVTRRGAALAVAPLLLGSAVAIPMLPAGRDGGEYRLDRTAMEQVCTEDTPRVCLQRVHAYLLPEMSDWARHALGLLAPLPDPPTTAVEWRYLGPDTNDVQPPDTMLFHLELAPYERPTQSEGALWEALDGAAASNGTCTVFHQHDTVARRLAAALLIGTLPPTDDGLDEQEASLFHETYRRLSVLPHAERIRRVAALRHAVLTCQGDLYQVLTEGVS
ncbi:MAG: cytochrome d ubiquinol oxidase subunit II [Actinomycetales bacterium]|nr:cytochrome d ubiquinol oxidase subunit II [Actinomycetales bacterium]